jgi:hypothetical protein
MKLGPNFLEEENPKLISISSRETDSFLFARNTSINSNQSVVSILGTSNTVHVFLHDFLSDKHLSNSIRFFCQSSQNTKEITISKSSLLDIIWFNTSREDSQLSIFIVQFWNLGSSDPFNVSPVSCRLFDIVVVFSPISDQAIFIGWELIIIKFGSTKIS